MEPESAGKPAGSKPRSISQSFHCFLIFPYFVNFHVIIHLKSKIMGKYPQARPLGWSLTHWKLLSKYPLKSTFNQSLILYSVKHKINFWFSKSCFAKQCFTDLRQWRHTSPDIESENVLKINAQLNTFFYVFLIRL